MSSFGDLGRFFDTAWCTAWPSAPPKKRRYIFELRLIHLWFFIYDFYFLEIFRNFFLGGALPGSAGFFKKPTQIPNAGHPISPSFQNTDAHGSNSIYVVALKKWYILGKKCVQVDFVQALLLEFPKNPILVLCITVGPKC
jgi:hypothetical protein